MFKGKERVLLQQFSFMPSCLKKTYEFNYFLKILLNIFILQERWEGLDKTTKYGKTAEISQVNIANFLVLWIEQVKANKKGGQIVLMINQSCNEISNITASKQPFWMEESNIGP